MTQMQNGHSILQSSVQSLQTRGHVPTQPCRLPRYPLGAAFELVSRLSEQRDMEWPVSSRHFTIWVDLWFQKFVTGNFLCYWKSEIMVNPRNIQEIGIIVTISQKINAFCKGKKGEHHHIYPNSILLVSSLGFLTCSMEKNDQRPRSWFLWNHS